MWSIPYIYLLILVLCPSWYLTILFGLLCAVFFFSVMCVACRLRLRMIAKAIRVRFDEKLEERIRIACELQDTMLQTVQGSKFLAEAALERTDDSAQLRLTLEKLSGWLGQATQEGQAVLNSLRNEKAPKSQE